MTSDEAASKRVAFYQELVSGWVTTQIEADKQAMTLSGLAIGLLMVLHRSINTSHGFVLWSLAGVAFFMAIISGIRVFYVNARYVEHVIGGDDDIQEAQVLNQLSRLTHLIYGSFLTGAFLTAILAVISTPFIQKVGAN